MPAAANNPNNHFFQGSYKAIWKKLIPAEFTKAECDFLIEAISPGKTDRILDLMCGYGRHALELGRRGIAVKGIDNEDDYIKELLQNAAQESLPVDAFTGDILDAEFSGGYKAVICMGNSFAFFNKEDATALLKKVNDALSDDGVFIMSSWMIAEIALRHFRDKEWKQVDEYKYLLSHTYYPIPARVESEHTIIHEDGAMEVIEGIDYIYSFSELEAMFNEAGLKTRHLYSTPRKKRFVLGDPAAYIVAVKMHDR